MKHLFFDYSMQIDYSTVVSKCNYTIKCIPQDTKRQMIDRMDVELYPETTCAWGTDGLGNRQIYGVNDQEHSLFRFRISGHAQTGLADYEEDADESMAMIFRHPHGFNVAGEGICAYYQAIQGQIQTQQDAYTQAIAVMHRLYQDYSYQKNVTTVNTTAEEAFLLGHGVCQDYAHIFIALMHLFGVPARYVTGLILGEGASHAWAEILHNGRWYGFDPTNDTVVGTDHIKIGVGRDAGDCMINRGIMKGGGLHTQAIHVNVIETEG